MIFIRLVNSHWLLVMTNFEAITLTILTKMARYWNLWVNIPAYWRFEKNNSWYPGYAQHFPVSILTYKICIKVTTDEWSTISEQLLQAKSLLYDLVKSHGCIRYNDRCSQIVSVNLIRLLISNIHNNFYARCQTITDACIFC